MPAERGRFQPELRTTVLAENRDMRRSDPQPSRREQRCGADADRTRDPVGPVAGGEVTRLKLEICDTYLTSYLESDRTMNHAG